MKKLLLSFVFSLLPLIASAKINVVATLPVFASIAREVGGDRVEVTSLARGDQDPHFLDAKPSFVVKLSQADLLIHGGLELEIGWLPPIVVQARNPKINNGTAGNVDLSVGLNILEVPQTPVNRSMGDVHPRGNPHAWLDPNNAKVMAVNIVQHLSEIDPSGKDVYNDRLKSFITKLNGKIAEWHKETEGWKGKQVVTYHKSLSYVAGWTGLDVVANVEPKPGIPPSSRYVDELIDKTKGQPVKAILMETFYPTKLPRYLSQKTGIPLVMIPTDVGEEGVSDYFGLIDALVGKIGSAM
ncbi:MAG TPA: metal ABC transporter substrate-binding protein [bacterium]|nr:metal ABC transporter substrate-binding protein [bacterium]